MEDIVYKTAFGTGGFLATIGLQEVNTFVSILVGLATLCYMTVSIIKVIKGFKK